MFSPGATVNSANGSSVRNPRRRRRNDSSGPPRQPARKRSKLEADTFHAPAVLTNGQSGDGLNGYVDVAKRRLSNTLDFGDGPLPVREKRHASLPMRATKADENTILTRNANYTVRQLPAPPRIRNPTAPPYRATLRSTSTSNCAVAVTTDHIIIWDYTTGTGNPTPRTLNLPQPLKQSEQLPLAALSASDSSSDIGLVLVHPTSGHITFWENVDALEPVTLLKHRRDGIEGHIQGMGRGDLVEAIVEAEHAGYILRFASGKLAHLMVRDAQGRARIIVNHLGSSVQGGWLSGWLGSWKNHLASVITRSLPAKGNVEVVAATETGVFKSWEVNWTGQNRFTAEVNGTDEVRDTLVQENILNIAAKEDFKVIDCVLQRDLSTDSNEVVLAQDKESTSDFKILALIAIEGANVLKYVLLQLTLTRENISLHRIIPVVVFQPQVATVTRAPRLLLPQPEHTAFLVLEHAVVVASTSHREETPEDQLLAEAGRVPAGFQDVLHLRQGKTTTIIDSALEPTAHSTSHASSVVLCTQAEGLIRIVSTPPGKTKEPADQDKVTVRSKLEQAIIYGSDSNPLDLSNTTGFDFPQKDVEEAAISVSQGIVRTNVDGLPEVSASMEQHLSLRATYLRDLANHLKAHYPPLSRVTRWTLLWDAEKIAAARSMWHTYEKSLKDLPLLQEVIEWAHHKDSHTKVKEKQDKDSVRRWFTRNVHRIDKMFPAIRETMKSYHLNDIIADADVIHWSAEATDLMCGALEAAFDSRAENLQIYGLDAEDLDSGILKSGFEGLPEFWTSRSYMINAFRSAVTLFFKVVTFEKKKPSEKLSEAVKGHIQRVIRRQPALVLLTCKVHMERYRWLLAQEDQALRESGMKVQHEFESSIRTELFATLASLGQTTAAMEIAEGLSDIKSLVQLVFREQTRLQALEGDAHLDDATKHRQQRLLRQLEERTRGYFSKFGEPFARTFYEGEIRQHHVGDLMTAQYGSQEQFTTFLRSDFKLAKISWINEVLTEKSMSMAAEALMAVAEKQEVNDWCKRIELSLAKLALIAEQSPKALDRGKKGRSVTLDQAVKELLDENSRKTLVLDVQQRLYRHVRPTVEASIDEDGAIANVLETFGAKATQGRNALHQLLAIGFSELLQHHVLSPTDLIDVLTLMDQSNCETQQDDIAGQEFNLALKVLEASDLFSSIGKPDSEGELFLRLIWKRLLVRDDWKSIKITKGKSDDEQEAALKKTALFQTLKNGYAECTPSFPSLIRLPSNLIGAGSDPRHLSSRFATEDLGKPIAADNARDDKVIEHALQHYNLERWFGITKDLAKAAAQEEAETKSAENEAARQFAANHKGPRVVNSNLDLDAYLDDWIEREEARNMGVERVYDEEGEEDAFQAEEEDGLEYPGSGVNGVSQHEDVEMDG